MTSSNVSSQTSSDARSNHLAEAERQASIAAEAVRQAGLQLARHIAETARQTAQEAQEREARRREPSESGKAPLAHKFRQGCLNEMHISLSTGYKYVGLGKIKIFRLGGCTMISDEESRRVLSEGVR